jgi:hypothetical protein
MVVAVDKWSLTEYFNEARMNHNLKILLSWSAKEWLIWIIFDKFHFSLKRVRFFVRTPVSVVAKSPFVCGGNPKPHGRILLPVKQQQ